MVYISIAVDGWETPFVAPNGGRGREHEYPKRSELLTPNHWIEKHRRNR